MLRRVGLAGWVVAGARGGYLARSGWLRSYNAQLAVDAVGRPIPWFCYAATAFLEQRLQPHFTVFEYGVGQSSLWLAARVAMVRGVDHDAAWVARVLAHQLPNLHIEHATSEAAYSTAIAGQHYHLVVVDGIHRAACCEQAVQHLLPEGVLILDNAERGEYQPSINWLLAQGFRQLPFTGLTPASIELVTTSIFYRPDNCLGI